LIPRPETEFLVELIKNKISSPVKILDVGTGTGCIALMLKKLFPESIVDACDISDEALNLAKENSEINNLEINLFQSDLLSAVEDTDYDVIVANLPYIPTGTLSSLASEVIDHEPLIALDGGDDGLLYINKLINEIEAKDIDNFMLFLEVDTSHASTILNNLSHWKEVELEQDLVERDRYIIAKR
jgi:release factor glutamine methyltransferase